jgi:phosphoserine phosphatase
VAGSSAWKKLYKDEIFEILNAESSKMNPKLKWVFDWDGTLMRGDVGIQGAWGLLRSGLASPDKVPTEWDVDHLRDMNNSDFEHLRNELAIKIGFNEVFEMESTLLAGFPVDVARRIIEDTLDIALKAGSIRRLEPMGELLRAKAKQNNALVVSGSPKLCVSTVAAHYGVPANNVYATELNIVDGVYREEYGPHGIVWAGQKKVVLESEGHSEVFFVAGDSTGDWDMMQLAQGCIWAVLWPRKENPWSTLREQLEINLEESLLPLPQREGIYIAKNPSPQGPRYWVVEIHVPHL